jgi:hypothetical protein
MHAGIDFLVSLGIVALGLCLAFGAHSRDELHGGVVISVVGYIVACGTGVAWLFGQ